MIRTLFVAVALLSSCATPRITQVQYLHSLTLERNGNVQTVEVQPGRDGSQLSPLPNNEVGTQVGHIGRAIESHDRVLIYVHGGLNTLEGGLETTQRLSRLILQDTENTTYPVFINWNSDLLSSYGAHLLHYRKGKRVQDFWGAVSAPFIFVADLGRAIVRFPIVLYDQGYEAATRLTTGVRVREASEGWQDQAKLVDQYARPTGERILDGLTQFVPGVVRLITTPLTDTLGFAGYDMIQRRIDTLFRTEADLRGQTSAPTGALTQLMQAIPEHKPVVLIGHSMGAIVLNELVRRHPNHNYESIVFMGAACTIHDFANAIPAYLTEHTRAQFYNLCLHPAADVNEVNYLSTIPNGSLLEWLDAFVLGPRTSFDRTMGKWNNIVQCLGMLGDLPDTVRERIWVKGFPVDGERFPFTHGGLNDFVFWRADYWDPKMVGSVPAIAELERSLTAR